MARRRRSRFPRIVPFVLLLVVGLATPRAASAHLVLVSSQPRAGATLDSAPPVIALTFSEDPQLAATRIELVDTAGARIETPAPRLIRTPAHTLEIAIAGSLAPGTYTVRWRTTSDDGHPVHGSFTFTVAKSAAAQATLSPAAPAVTPAGRSAVRGADSMAMDTSESGGFDVESPWYVVVRWLGFAGMLALVGSVVLARRVTPRASGGRPELARRVETGAGVVLRLAALLLLADAALRLVAQVAALRGSPPMPVDVRGIVTGTVWGWAWILEVAAAFAAVAVGWPAARGGAARWRTAGVCALLLALSFSMSGHAAAATHWRALAVSADALHILGAGSWLGTLLGVAVVAMPACLAQPEGARGAAAAGFVNAFSPVALASAGVVVITGVVAAWLRLGSWHAFVDSDYGRTLLIKLALVATVVALGAVNWRILRPALGTEIAARRLRRSAAFELVAAAAVLAATAVLVAASPPADNEMGSAQPPLAPAGAAVSAPAAHGMAMRARVPRAAGT